jgi:TctA family transporter
MQHQNTAVPIQAIPVSVVPVHVVYERPKPRLAKGFFVFLVSGILGVIIFAMGQTVWGAIWRSWLVTIVVAISLYLLLHR